MVIIRSLVCLAHGHDFSDVTLGACRRCGAAPPLPVDLSRRTFLFGALATGAIIAAGPLSALDAVPGFKGFDVGDILLGAGDLVRLARGMNGQVLTITAGLPSWTSV